MVAFITPPNAPQWHLDLVLQLNREFADYGVMRVFDSADLPLAARNRMQTVYASDLGTLVLSDGTDWRPVSLGSPI